MLSGSITKINVMTISNAVLQPYMLMLINASLANEEFIKHFSTTFGQRLKRLSTIRHIVISGQRINVMKMSKDC